MSNIAYWRGLGSITLAGLIIRLASLCPFGFFCDVPNQIKSVLTNRLQLQFPGYMPIMLLFSGMAKLGLTAFEAMWVFSLACGMGSVVYVALAARRAVGESFSLLCATVMAVGVLPVYFSVVGTTYATDMLCASGLLYHGLVFLEAGKARNYYLALACVCFGMMMRPVSAVFCCFGLGVLLWQGKDWRAWVVTAVALALTLVVFAEISIPYYGSLRALLDSRFAAAGELANPTLQDMATNVTRAVVYPIYGFHLWLVFTAWVMIKNWASRKGRYLLFLSATGGVYFLCLLRFIPHAGYFGLLIPVLVLLPACFLRQFPLNVSRVFTFVAATFVIVASCEWWLMRPIKTTSLARGAANAYVLMYSRSGINQGMYETLSSIMMKAQINTNLIPARRVEEIRRGGH